MMDTATLSRPQAVCLVPRRNLWMSLDKIRTFVLSAEPGRRAVLSVFCAGNDQLHIGEGDRDCTRDEVFAAYNLLVTRMG